jgi:hypothetical protein
MRPSNASVLGAAFAVALVLAPSRAPAGTELEAFERALDRVAGNGARGKHESGLCVCADRGAWDGRAGNLVSLPDLLDDTYFRAGCEVRRFDLTTGEPTLGILCFPYLPSVR